MSDKEFVEHSLDGIGIRLTGLPFRLLQLLVGGRVMSLGHAI